MSVETDPALYKSNYELLENDKYPTEHWIPKALLLGYNRFDKDGVVWEPAAGFGDITESLKDRIDNWYLSDIKPDAEGIQVLNFLEQTELPRDDITAIMTNPPYSNGLAELFIRKSLNFLHRDDNNLSTVALLLRSEYNHAVTRRDLFSREAGWVLKIDLLTRPRWDWRMPEGERDKAGPRHNFSWYVWDNSSHYSSDYPIIKSFSKKDTEE